MMVGSSGPSFFPRLFLTEQPPAPRMVRLPHYRWLVVGTVCVGAFLGQLDASIATLVLPTLEEVFHAEVAAVEWVAIAYLVTLAALVVTFGRLADMTGRKLLYNGGFVVFILGSFLCGFAPNLGLLIVFRVVQAVGAAMLQANSVAIITAVVPHTELGRAIGVQGAAQAVGLSIGPSVGGFLIGTLGWQWVFFIAVPFGLIGTVMAWLVLPQTGHAAPEDTGRERFDWWGAATFAAAVAVALLALTFGNSWGWNSRPLMVSLAVAATAVALFVAVERQTAFPLVDFGLFRERVFSAGILSGLLSYSVLFGALFLVPFYLQRVLGFSPQGAGLVLTVIPVAIGVLAPISGIITDRIGSRTPTVLGMLLAVVALIVLTVDARAPLAVVLAILALLGVGLGFFTPPNNSAIMGSAPPNRLGVAGGVLNMTRSLGTSLGVAATGAVLALSLSALAGHAVQGTLGVTTGQLLVAFRDCLLFLAVLAAVAGVVAAARGSQASTAPAEAKAESLGV
jgi:EmrB/QacA subfamily drug resistance transporter